MNNYNTIFKGQLILEKDQHFFIFENDKLEVPVNVQPKFYNWLITNEIDISYPRIYQGQFITQRHPYLKVDELRNIDLNDSMITPDSFEVNGRVFRVYHNCVDKFDADYNFLLVSVGIEPNRFPLKICFSRLDNYNLKDRFIRFTLKRIGYNLVLHGYRFIDVEDDLIYGQITND